MLIALLLGTKLYLVALCSTAKTMKGICFRVNLATWFTILVKRTIDLAVLVRFNVVRKLAALRKEMKLSQTDLAKQLKTSVSVISRYERDEMAPSIETAKKLATLLDTTVGYLLGENENAEVFRNPDMLRRFKDIISFPKEKQEHILFALDSMIKATKLERL
jgi:transcriptional regulator with XRE-family HTH domain